MDLFYLLINDNEIVLQVEKSIFQSWNPWLICLNVPSAITDISMCLDNLLYRIVQLDICVPARLNEALCGKIDFELQAKIWAKVKIFHFWCILSKYSSYQTHSWQTFFSLKLWKKRCVMEHFILEWPTVKYT